MPCHSKHRRGFQFFYLVMRFPTERSEDNAPVLKTTKKPSCLTFTANMSALSTCVASWRPKLTRREFTLRAVKKVGAYQWCRTCTGCRADRLLRPGRSRVSCFRSMPHPTTHRDRAPSTALRAGCVARK